MTFDQEYFNRVNDVIRTNSTDAENLILTSDSIFVVMSKMFLHLARRVNKLEKGSWKADI